MPRPMPSVDLLRTATGRKLLRYGAASVVNVVVAQVVLAWAFGVLHWTARAAAVLAAIVAAGPAFWLARSWVWGRSGRTHLVKEVLPFWGMALLGLVLTTWVAGVAETASADLTDSRLGQTLILMGAVFGISGVIWAVKFFVLNGVLFADRSVRSTGEMEVPAVPKW
jgi:putative flippase GtrA